ncbi:MAG: NUDIX domain-containing protein [Anaerolineales bacterium]
MSQDGQRLDPDRYAVIPRTISFVVHYDQILLIQLASDHEGWASLYNGIGGHVESGEEPLTAARREVLEETGLSLADQQLCGVVIVDMGTNSGIALFVFVGEALETDLLAGPEGVPTWVPVDRLEDYELVEDLGFLIPQALEAWSDNTIFFAGYSYDAHGELQIRLTE